ncbi:MAG: response regulator [Proteobacteria bacterium]|nr:response regulator [Pseudomonadota bacterium]MDE3208767.1 response regulator [Pseudomonadota bacterium]
MRLYLAEDDTVLREGLTRSLRQAGYHVDSTDNGQDADLALSMQEYDLVILDLNLPRMDGLQILKRLRGRQSRMPVLILTARDLLEDRVAGLDLGADDYMTKPFDLPELEARVRALIRRHNGSKNEFLQSGILRLDLAGRRAYVRDEPIELSAREIGVMEVLMLRQGRVVSKELLAEKLCGWSEEVGNNAIEVYVHRLRKKLEDAGIQIRTIRGLGYMLEKSP